MTGRALPAALVAALLFAAQGSGAAPAGTAPNGGQVVIAYWDQPTSLDPLTADFGSAAAIVSAFSSSLVTQSADGKVIPDLARDWTVSPDGLTWDFTLRPGLRFSDGSPLTSADVLATFRTALNPSKSTLGLLREPILTMDAPTAGAFRIRLKAPYSALPELVQVPVVPAAVLNGDAQRKIQYEKQPYGAGPFKIIEWTPARVLLEMNSLYYKGRPHLDRILYRHFADREQAWAAFIKGDVDVMFDIPYDQFSLVRQDPRFLAHDFLDAFSYSILFNLKDPLLAQKGIRQAISLAIDRLDLVDKILPGRAVPATGPFPPGSWAYDDDPGLQPYDQDRARKLLKDLGWKDTNGDWLLDKDGKDLRFTVMIDDNDTDKASVAKRLQWQLMQVGIRMDLQVLPLSEFVSDHLMVGRFQAAIVQEATFDNPDTAVNTFWSTSTIGATNLVSYSNPEVDRLIALGRTVTDLAKKAQIYHDIHRRIAADAPAEFLYFMERYTACTARLHNYDAGHNGFVAARPEDWYLE